MRCYHCGHDRVILNQKMPVGALGKYRCEKCCRDIDQRVVNGDKPNPYGHKEHQDDPRG